MPLKEGDFNPCEKCKIVLEYKEKNEKLEETVQWMHDLIWELIKEIRDSHVIERID